MKISYIITVGILLFILGCPVSQKAPQDCENEECWHYVPGCETERDVTVWLEDITIRNVCIRFPDGSTEVLESHDEW